MFVLRFLWTHLDRPPLFSDVEKHQRPTKTTFGDMKFEFYILSVDRKRSVRRYRSRVVAILVSRISCCCGSDILTCAHYTPASHMVCLCSLCIGRRPTQDRTKCELLHALCKRKTIENCRGTQRIRMRYASAIGLFLKRKTNGPHLFIL